MIFKLLFPFIFFFILIVCSGQSNPGQSKEHLLLELKKELPDSTRQKLYRDLAKLFLAQIRGHKTNLDSALYYLRKSVYLLDSTIIRYNPITNENLCLLAESYFQAGNIDEGKKKFMQVITNYQKTGDKIREAETWHRQAQKLLYLETDFDDILISYNHAIIIYTQLGNSLKQIDVRLELANFHFRLRYVDRAEKEFLTLIRESKENGAYKLSYIYYCLSELKRYDGDFTAGLNFALNAMKSMEQNHDTTEVHNFYGELALEYQEVNQPEKSIYWYKKCIEERKKIHLYQYAIYRTIYLMVVQMIKAHQEKEALVVLQNLKKSDPPTGPSENAVLSQSLANCYNSMKQYASAEKYFLTMIKDFGEEERNGEVLLIANFDIGQFYVNQRQYSKAERYLKDAFINNYTTTISRVKDLHLLLFKVDSANGHFTSAIEHFQKYKAINDSIFNETKSKQIEELMIKYEVEKKDNDIKLYEKENKLQQGKLTQERQTRNWILGGVALLLIILGLLINNSRLKQRTNKKLKNQQNEIQKKNISLHQLVIEKEWLVKEIHHRVKNNFHIVMGLLGTQSEYLKSHEAILAMAESQHRIHAMSLIHQKLYQSDNLSAINMAEYIHELVNYLVDSFNIRKSIQFKLEIEPVELGLSYSIPLGLIMNEAITNSIKYAFPNNKEGVISITFKHVSEYHVLLTIHDNGVGLPPGFNTRSPVSMGMKLMQGLNEDIDGKFSINNHNGTEIRLDFNYDPEINAGIIQTQSVPPNSI